MIFSIGNHKETDKKKKLIKTIRINDSSKVSVYTDSVYKCHFYFSLLAMNTPKQNLENNWIHKIFKDHKNFRSKFYKSSARLIH